MLTRSESYPLKWARRSLAFVAIAFGIATVVAGTRVLLGSDPGYVVFGPLLAYNTAMGAVYVVAGILGLRSPRRGAYAAGLILALNALVLGAIGYLYATGQAVAVESVRAMAFRTVVWGVLLAGFIWAGKREAA